MLHTYRVYDYTYLTRLRLKIYYTYIYSVIRWFIMVFTVISIYIICYKYSL